jgi:signal transduction histidine kinase
LILNGLLFFLALPTLPRRSEFGIASGPVFGFFSGLVVVVTLQLRARSIQKAHSDMQLSLQLAEQEVNYERQQREAQNRFMGMLTHELKTPLGVLLMAISHSDPSLAMKERAKRAIQDMNAVLERCVLVDKLEEGNLSQSKERFDVVKELEQVMLGFDSTRLQLAHGHASVWVYADRQLVSVVLKNLVENALKYSPKDSRVHLNVQRLPWREGEGVCVQVSNLPGDAGWPDAQRLFSKYYRSAGSHRSTGSGLGLHLAKQMALYLGGDVRYVPVEDCVRFEFWLPV